MNYVAPHGLRAAALALALLLLAPASLARGAKAPAPNPTLAPSAVVEIQLQALQQLDKPSKDAGYATVFRFSSPENRNQTGPLPKFIQMLQTGFGDLLLHRSHTLLTPVMQGEQALFPVELTTRNGRLVRYVWVLRQQAEGPYKNCWMTDGVVMPDDQPEGQET